jgi:hypothetical protein
MVSHAPQRKICGRSFGKAASDELSVIVFPPQWGVASAMTVTRDQEFWAMALYVEREHGTDGPAFITAQAERNRLTGDKAGSVYGGGRSALRFAEVAWTLQ